MIKEVEMSMNLDTATWEKLLKLKKEQSTLPSVNENGEKQTTIKPRSEDFKNKYTTGTPIEVEMKDVENSVFNWKVEQKKKKKLLFYPETKLIEIQTTEEYFHDLMIFSVKVFC
jgi:hypothetical protein